jgi:leader peptidase (prepilin peptidase)/N-methyltransferase
MDWAVFVPVFFLGTITGSLLNVLIYRIPAGVSIFSPRSYCPKCKTPIPFYRNIPILSFLIQKGKCGHCNKSISIQYPVIEIISGLVWAWTFTTQYWQNAIFLSLLISILIVISWIDFLEMVIPLNLILLSGVFICVAVIFQILPIQQTLVGGLVGPTTFGIILGISFLVSKRQGMGTGDIHLSAILGGWQGPLNITLILFIASLISLLTWFVISLFKGFDKNRALPFAPFLVLSAIGLYVAEFYLKTTILEILFL